MTSEPMTQDSRHLILLPLRFHIPLSALPSSNIPLPTEILLGARPFNVVHSTHYAHYLLSYFISIAMLMPFYAAIKEAKHKRFKSLFPGHTAAHKS